MFKKIFTFCWSFFAVIFVTSSTLFTGFSSVDASQMDSNMNEDNQMNIVIEESVDSTDASSTKSTPDLGDDQAFPFIPGFGKNSGKD